ncbi:VOC family protein [Dactylosporangium salmoneum]|uniref:Glyoxalase-like domain-containing protein n=1 Tax=Dactylosporangium salmoneum TaxID=53361 RepID=A0ABP5SP51_9ACTN
MIGTLDVVVLDAADYRGLAAFYGALTGWEQTYADEDWVSLKANDGWKVGFQLAPDHTPPQWPGQDRPQQAHLDIRVPALEPALERVLSLGGTLLRRNERWITVADPAGHPFDLDWQPGATGWTLLGPVLDCPDPWALSLFYTALLGKELTQNNGDGLTMIGEAGDRPMLFQEVAGYNPPRWPDPAHPQQLHLDVLVDDLDAAEEATLALGATKVASTGRTFRVFLDPVGKPFCLCTEPG